MYRTGGLFHPLLSQRIYQSNQGLKLSAKAFRLPKGAFICLQSHRPSNDSEADMKQKRTCFLSGVGPAAQAPLATPCPIWRPQPLILLSLSGCTCHAPFSKMTRLHLWMSADRPHRAPGPCLSEPVLRPFKEGTPWESPLAALTSSPMVVIRAPVGAAFL